MEVVHTSFVIFNGYPTGLTGEHIYSYLIHSTPTHKKKFSLGTKSLMQNYAYFVIPTSKKSLKILYVTHVLDTSARDNGILSCPGVSCTTAVDRVSLDKCKTKNHVAVELLRTVAISGQ
jgi:hypothetical protein